METEKQQQRAAASHLPFCLKCSAIFLLLSLSVLVIACSASNTTATDPNGPESTATILFNNNLSSLGTVLPYMCGAWTNTTTPGFNPGSDIAIYAHFVHNVDGNPIGVSGASAEATVEWADGSRDNQAATTTSDGLAVFYFTIPNQPDLVGKNNLVTVSFTGPNGQTCSVDNQSQPGAFFTLVVASPTPTVTSTAPTVESTQPVISPIITPPFLPPGKRNQTTPTPSGLPPGF